MFNSAVVAVMPSRVFNSTAVAVTPSRILSSAVVAVTPSSKFNSAVVAVTPSSRLISAAVGLAIPKMREHYGYISEHHTFGETARKSGDYAEDLAATMLATTLGIQFDPDEAWDSRKQVYKASNYIFKSDHICQSAEGNKNGNWTTVISAAIMLL